MLGLDDDELLITELGRRGCVEDGCVDAPNMAPVAELDTSSGMAGMLASAGRAHVLGSAWGAVDLN